MFGHSWSVGPPAARAAAAAAVAAVLAAAGAAAAQEEPARRSGDAETHTVAEGETLGRIAREHGVSVADLSRENGIEDADRISVGQEIRIPRASVSESDPPRRASPSGGRGDGERVAADDGETGARVTRRGVRLRVAEGQTLSDIANSYGVGLSALRRANGIEDADTLRVGQRILVPGATRVVEVRRVRRDPYAGWSRPVTIERVATGEEITVRLFDQRGRVPRETQAKIDHLLRQASTDRQRKIDAGLLRLVQRVADHWPDRRLRVYSGFRPFRKGQHTPKSNHNVGRALDFVVEGVPNAELRDFCRTLPDAGVGYYPNSRFVHVDTRDRRAYWVDYSEPGEAPRYGREDRGDPAAAEPEAEADRDVEEQAETAAAGD